eukprot:c14324_g2_i2 orf=43-396(+)
MCMFTILLFLAFCYCLKELSSAIVLFFDQNFFGIQSCGAIYWIVTLVQVPFAIIVTACSMIYLQKENADDNETEDGDSVSSLEDTSSLRLGSISLLPLYALVAGFLGGMLGLGGGMI